VAASALLWAACTRGAQLAPGGTTIDRDDIAGVVTGASGPEAGVWVIAETSDLPTKFARIVVTDGRGATSSPTSRRRATTSGCVGTGWSTRRGSGRSPGRR
jgi:hypothetical protein